MNKQTSQKVYKSKEDVKNPTPPTERGIEEQMAEFEKIFNEENVRCLDEDGINHSKDYKTWLRSALTTSYAEGSGVCTCKENMEALSKEWEKKVSKARAEGEKAERERWENKIFDLYQSHDCHTDTACKFEDRLGDLMMMKSRHLCLTERKP